MSPKVSDLVDDPVGIGGDRSTRVSAVVRAFRYPPDRSLQADSVLLSFAVVTFLLMRNDVSGATTANGVHWSNGVAAELVALKLFVEGEHGTLRCGVSVTDTTTASVEGAGLWLDVVRLCFGSRDFGLGKLAIVAGAANAGVVVGGVWSWFVSGEAHC